MFLLKFLLKNFKNVNVFLTNRPTKAFHSPILLVELNFKLRKNLALILVKYFYD